VKGGGEIAEWEGSHGGESERPRQALAVESRNWKARRVATKSGGVGRCQEKKNRKKLTEDFAGSSEDD
jgi:hypothetical protein